MSKEATTTRPILRIARWDEVFETAESRRHSTLRWVSMPIEFHSAGYQAMVDEFGPDHPAIYGAWCALVALAATMPVRGRMANSRGVPLSAEAIARMTCMPVSVMQRLIEWATKPEICWIYAEKAGTDPAQHPPSDGPAAAQPLPSDSPAPTWATQLQSQSQSQVVVCRRNGKRGVQGGGSLPAADLPAVIASIDPASIQRACCTLARALDDTGHAVDRAFVVETCWSAAVISSIRGRGGMIADWCSAIREMNGRQPRVARPRRYIEAGLEAQASQAGVTLDAIRAALREAMRETPAGSPATSPEPAASAAEATA